MDGSVILSLLGLLVAFALMAILIFNKWSPILAGPLAVIIVCLTSNLPLLQSILEAYVPGVGGFFISYFLIFLLGNMFGNLYQLSGAASAIGVLISKIFGAKRKFNCMLAVLVATALLSYGGINSFVIIFAMYPIALKLFEEADIHTRLLPGIVAGGMWTFAMTGPFTPQIPNIVPMEALGTPSYAGLLPGVVGALTMAVIILVYMTWEANRSAKNGEHFAKPTHVEIAEEDVEKPNSIISLIPLLIVVLGFNLTSINIVAWLAAGCLSAIILFWKYMPGPKLKETINAAASSSISVIMNTAAIVGFGAVVKLTPLYAFAVEMLEATNANPYVIAAVGSNVFAGILGSASGGVGLMFSSLKDTFLSFGEMGYNMEYVHRLCSFGCGGLDSMPWNGSIVSVMSVTGNTHKQSYFPIFINCLVVPVFVTLCVALPICILTGAPL